MGSAASQRLKDQRAVTRVMRHLGQGPAMGLLETDGSTCKTMSGATLEILPRRVPGGLAGWEQLWGAGGQVP